MSISRYLIAKGALMSEYLIFKPAHAAAIRVKLGPRREFPLADPLVQCGPAPAGEFQDLRQTQDSLQPIGIAIPIHVPHLSTYGRNRATTGGQVCRTRPLVFSNFRLEIFGGLNAARETASVRWREDLDIGKHYASRHQHGLACPQHGLALSHAGILLSHAPKLVRRP
jgi:hypothetical protein